MQNSKNRTNLELRVALSFSTSQKKKKKEAKKQGEMPFVVSVLF